MKIAICTICWVIGIFLLVASLIPKEAIGQLWAMNPVVDLINQFNLIGIAGIIFASGLLITSIYLGCKNAQKLGVISVK